MPKRQQYESEGGFVEDAPKKKAKSGGNELKKAEGKATINTEMQQDDDGNEYWEISRTRRVQISEFKGATMVNIREFYSKDDGKMLPGKKGISLSIDQFTALLDILPDLESTLKTKGIAIPRPKYESSNSAKKTTDKGKEADDEDDEDDEEAEEAEKDPHEAKTSKKLSKFMHKANHEATSDEDEE